MDQVSYLWLFLSLVCPFLIQFLLFCYFLLQLLSSSISSLLFVHSSHIIFFLPLVTLFFKKSFSKDEGKKFKSIQKYFQTEFLLFFFSISSSLSFFLTVFLLHFLPSMLLLFLPQVLKISIHRPFTSWLKMMNR